jgi:hypothetical protein
MKTPMPPKPDNVSLFFFRRFWANTDLSVGDDWYDWKNIENIPTCGIFDFPSPLTLEFDPAPANVEFEFIELPLNAALFTLHEEMRFELNPLRWHRVKKMLSDGRIEYPEMTLNKEGIPVLMDGRHRIVAMMKLMGMEFAPFAVEPAHVAAVRRYFF